jgi:cytochrome c-type protein NapB
MRAVITLSDRALHIVGIVVGCLVVLAMVHEWRYVPPSPTRALPSAAVPASPVPAYADLRSLRRGPNGQIYANAFDRLALVDSPQPGPPSAAERDAALTLRQQRRAYDGAPPAVPHEIGQRTPSDCLVCHERGARLAGRIARQMSHRYMPNCVQCHPVEMSPRPLEAPAAADLETDFAGLSAPHGGERAYPGAPPTIPHATLLRSRCESCHGSAGLFGLRTPHLERVSCTQCHAPSAELDQRN